MTKEELQLLSDMFDEKLDPINERLDKIDERLVKIEEDVEDLKYDMKEVRVTVDEVCKWIELNFDHKYPLPIDKNVV